jgi:gluconolactonase
LLPRYPFDVSRRTTGVGNTEGPVHLQDGGVAFVSMSHGVVYRADAPGGPARVVADVGGSPNGLVEDRDGSLYVAQNGGTPLRAPRDRIAPGVQVLRPDGSHELLFSDGMVAPNDLAFGPDRRLYVTDPTRGRRDDGRIWRCDPRSGEVSLLAHVPWYPNGIGFATDDGLMFVADTGGRRIVQYELDEKLTEPVTVIAMPGETEPDGFAFDNEGNVVIACTSPSKGRGDLQVYSLQGDLLQVVGSTDGPFLTNVALSGSGELVFTDASGGAICWIGDWPASGIPLHPFRP